MATFYLNTVGRDSGIPTGSDSPFEADNLDAAKCEAARYLGRIVCDQADKFWETGDLFIAVSDDKGLVLFTLEVIGHDAPALRLSTPPIS